MSTSLPGARLDGATAFPMPLLVETFRRLSAVVVLGIPSALATEVGVRVHHAILASGFEMPRSRLQLTVDGARVGVDLGLALATLVETGQTSMQAVEGFLPYGELSLTGEVRWAKGTIAAARLAQAQGLTLLCAPSAAADLAILLGLPVATLPTLSCLCLGRPEPHRVTGTPFVRSLIDLRDITHTEEVAWDTLLHAVRTRAPILFTGPQGCNATMIASRLLGLLPDLNPADALEIATLRDAAGIGFDRIERPFRAPHHTVSLAGLCGGGGAIHELQLAHEGMLFLDAVDQFKRATLQALRDALKYDVGRPWLVLSGQEASPGSPEQIRQNQALDALGVATTVVRIPLKRRPNDPRAWPSTAALRARIQVAE